ncbi:MAG TPA: response regulator [Candidatus Sulfotelmatobacter sp.]|nr:response regulator [Candidatus Sulfotelmatobacter sp.]
MSSQSTILIVDDEPPIRRFLRTSLAAQDYRVVEADTGAAALARIADERPDLIVLDLGLPDIDGIELIRRIRQTVETPIVVLSVRDDERGKVEALDLGASDYVTKPFGTEELLARVRAALRHRLLEQGERPIFKLKDLEVDLVRRIVMRRQERIHLTPKEYELLRHLIAHAGKVLTHKQLLREIWGPAHVEDSDYLRSYVRMLRNKIEDDPAQPKLLLTEPGVGYRLNTLD